MIITDLRHLLTDHPFEAIPVVFGAGVLTSLTPCLYPMIPITAAIVGGQSTADVAPSRGRVATLTAAYVFGLALVYATLGLVAGLTGTLFGTVSSNPWLYFLMANVLLLSAFALLDVIPVRVPQRFVDYASRVGSGKARVGGAFAMGATSGAVAAPCSAPVMAAVLTWVGTTRSAALGFAYLFVFSVGMCTLLVVVGLFSGSIARLPKSGAWMVGVKKVLAFVMIAVAEYYLVQMGTVWF